MSDGGSIELPPESPDSGQPVEPPTPRPLAHGDIHFAHASEAEFARILDFYEVRWLYEPEVFPILWDLDGNVVESFTPDFYLPDLDMFVEMTTLQQRLVRKKNRKVRRLRELYPFISIKLFYARDFRALMLKYGRVALMGELTGAMGQVAGRHGTAAERGARPAERGARAAERGIPAGSSEEPAAAAQLSREAEPEAADVGPEPAPAEPKPMEPEPPARTAQSRPRPQDMPAQPPALAPSILASTRQPSLTASPVTPVGDAAIGRSRAARRRAARRAAARAASQITDR